MVNGIIFRLLIEWIRFR